jgi:hypothetical protein
VNVVVGRVPWAPFLIHQSLLPPVIDSARWHACMLLDLAGRGRSVPRRECFVKDPLGTLLVSCVIIVGFACEKWRPNASTSFTHMVARPFRSASFADIGT